MKILVFSDIHCDLNRIKQIVSTSADYYILCGDVSDLGDGLVEAGKAFSSLGKKLLVIPGNNETEEPMDVWCRDYGFTSLHRKVLKFGRYNFAGLGHSVYLPFSNPPDDLATPGEKSEEWFAGELRKFVGLKKLLLFMHEPPLNTKLDLVRSGVHVGSQAVRDFIIKEKPLHFFSGHIHECAGNKEVLSGAICHSTGKKGVLLSLD